jgi:hypothetical protein
MYDNDGRFEEFKEEEKDLILAIALWDFRLKLNKKDIRNAVKTDIWKQHFVDYNIKRLDGIQMQRNCLYTTNLVQ